MGGEETALPGMGMPPFGAAGAAGGLRQRAGLRVWPMLRQGEAELIAQIRQAQDPDGFSKMTAAGARLSRQQAVEAIGTLQAETRELPGAPAQGLVKPIAPRLA